MATACLMKPETLASMSPRYFSGSVFYFAGSGGETQQQQARINLPLTWDPTCLPRCSPYRFRWP